MEKYKHETNKHNCMINSHLAYRVWDEANKCFEYPQAGCRQFLMNMNGEIFDVSGCPYDEEYQAFRVSGLVTCFDDPIYEGDIVEYYLGSGFSQYGPYQAIVSFKNQSWQFVDLDNENKYSEAYQVEDIRVIGNIKQGLTYDK